MGIAALGGDMAIQEVVPEVPDTSVDGHWLPWRVSSESGFEVYVPKEDVPVEGDETGAGEGKGEVGLVQVDDSTFVVTNRFRFTNPEVQQMLVDRLVRRGMEHDEAIQRVENARTFTPRIDNPTDLASIPRFMRWFENPYGIHTLAAIIHDELITKEPNRGALCSDILGDRFFREMMRSAGVPWLKRWLMWAAVALRSRWAAGNYRRASVLAWLALALAGIAVFAWGVGSLVFSWDPPVDTAVLIVGAVVLPVLSAPLWGKQAGAALIAAIGAAWILPAAVFAGLGYLVYRLLERLADSVGLR